MALRCSILLLLTLALGCGASDYGDRDPAKSFVHRESGSAFVCPETWTMERPQTAGQLTIVKLRAEDGLEAAIYWRPTEHAELEPQLRMLARVDALREVHGERVAEHEEFKVGERTAYRILVEPAADGEPWQADYFFFATPPAGGDWTIRLQTKGNNEAIERVDALLDHFRWK